MSLKKAFLDILPSQNQILWMFLAKFTSMADQYSYKNVISVKTKSKHIGVSVIHIYTLAPNGRS